MKNRMILCLGSLLLSASLQADQTASYPKEKPVIDFTLPDGWEVESKEGALFASPKDDDSFILSLAPLESSPEEPQEAIKEAKGVIEEGFEKVTYEEIKKIEANGVAILLLQAKGEDEDGKANIASLLINKPEAKSVYFMQLVSSEEGFEKHGEAGLKIIRSVKAHEAGAAKEEAPEEGATGDTQTYHYPDKDHSAFSLSVPADWKVESDDKGAHIVAADKMFTATVVVVDSENAEDANESMKKDSGARYESIKWEDAVTHNQESTGMSLTSTEGIGVGKGVNYKVGVLQFSKKDSKKTYFVITWAPEKALEGNGEAIMKMLTSVKVN